MATRQIDCSDCDFQGEGDYDGQLTIKCPECGKIYYMNISGPDAPHASSPS